MFLRFNKKRALWNARRRNARVNDLTATRRACKTRGNPKSANRRRRESFLHLIHLIHFMCTPRRECRSRRARRSRHRQRDRAIRCASARERCAPKRRGFRAVSERARNSVRPKKLRFARSTTSFARQRRVKIDRFHIHVHVQGLVETRLAHRAAIYF